MAGRYLIYGLIDPTTSNLRYVGRSSSGLGRPKRHMSESTIHGRSYDLPVNRWIRKLGRSYEIVVLEEFDGTGDPNEWLNDAEQHHISYWKFVGCSLLNLTAGGMGMLGYRHRQETKSYLSEIQKGRVFSEDHRRKISVAKSQKRKPLSLEHRAKLSARTHDQWKQRREMNG